MKQHRVAPYLMSVLLVLAAPGILAAQATLDGLPRVATWTDLENRAGDLPTKIWGTCDETSENRIGIRVVFDNGDSASATYSGVSGLWNTGDFTGINADTATGFLANCTGMHYLYNNNTSLPLAWEICTNSFSGNFDLDFTEYFGSNFRADTSGWVSASFQTYCGTGTPVPTMPQWILVLTALLIVLGGLYNLRRRTDQSPV